MASGGSSGSDFALQVMELSLKKYSSLPKRGKPKKGEEWTPLATILSCEGINMKVFVCDDPLPTYNVVITVRGERIWCFGQWRSQGRA